MTDRMTDRMTDTARETKNIAFLVAPEGVERVELLEPWDAVVDSGHQAALLSTSEGEVQTFDHLDKSERRAVDHVVSSASTEDYDALVLPGGVANPDLLRGDEEAVAFVRDFVASGKPVAAICHAPWMLAEADCIKGRRVTSWPSLRTDLVNAGATWVDERLVIDGNLITSRKPDDLPAFVSALLEAVNHGADSAPVT